MNSGIQRWSFLTCGLAIFLSGCASTSNDLTMVSQVRRLNFKQNFSQAYAAVIPGGDFDVVLVHDANADGAADPNGPIHPAAIIPRQIVHIRIFWLPQRGAKLDHPVATNASIRWYVFGDRPEQADNLLEYSGSALVLVTATGDLATVTIRGAYLKPVACRGTMADPLGPSTVNGTVTALLNARRVGDLVDEVKSIDHPGSGQPTIN